MTNADLQKLKTARNQLVRIRTIDDEEFIARIISVFDEESEPDFFYELVSTSRPNQYEKHGVTGGWAMPLGEVASVEIVAAQPMTLQGTL